MPRPPEGWSDAIVAAGAKPLDPGSIPHIGLDDNPLDSLDIIMRRHELRSTIMTSNRPLEDWGKLIGDVPAAPAILDRFLQDAELIQITGRSY